MHLSAVALGFQQQLLPAGGVPVHEYDWPVDGIITPDGALERPRVSTVSKYFRGGI
jgi:5-formyltetrahydrofolate cyclo-ligase